MNSLTYWEQQPTDKPWLVNGFKGTWAFSDHDLIPDSLRNFIMYNFPKIERFKRIPLDEINQLMNSVWEGPGSMVKIQRLTDEMREKQIQNILSKSKPVVIESSERTIDDYDENEFSVDFGEQD